MTEIIVQLKESSVEGRLYYKPSSENIKHGMLYVESQQPRRMGYCVNIRGGQLLLYFDKHRLLQEIEFGVHQKRWRKSTTLSEPQAGEAEDIFLLGVKSYHDKWKHSRVTRWSNGLTIRNYWEDEIPMIVITNPELSVVQIVIGAPDQSSRWVSLSDPAGHKLPTII